MAASDRPTTDDLTWLERLAREPGSFDFHVALRRFEAAYGEEPRLGEAVRPADEPLRLGQIPSSNFEPSAVTQFTPGRCFRTVVCSWASSACGGLTGPCRGTPPRTRATACAPLATGR